MSTINWDSVLSKAQHHMSSPEKQKMIQKRIDDYMLGKDKAPSTAQSPPVPSEAAQLFIDVLQQTIEKYASSTGDYENGLGATAVNALRNLEHSSAVRAGNQRYIIGIRFKNDLQRKSLAPEKYNGVDNIAALLNSGYDAGHTVYGVWKGHGDGRIASLTKREGTHFIESAIRDFMANYAADYGVDGIEVDEEYK